MGQKSLSRVSQNRKEFSESVPKYTDDDDLFKMPQFLMVLIIHSFV